MKVEQLYTGCLAQGAYYIESNGEAAVIDPLREVQQYIDIAERRGAKIKYVLETHFHADFVSGHITLAKKTGADIIYGPTAKTDFDCIVAEDNQAFKLGDVTIKVLHTPGHTMESTCYLLLDEKGKEQAIFTGDTLFLGDVGRPDLAQKAADMTQEELAGMLYDSLRNKLMPLPDDLTVYPGHGAGSACGKNMSSETIGKLGEQKESNYALRADMSKEEFIKELTEGLSPPPAYFPLNVQMNKEGYADIDEVIEQGSQALSLEEFEKHRSNQNVLVLDTRHQSEFVKAHVPNSWFIGIQGGFAPWVGALIKDVETPIVLVSDLNTIKEVITRLSRVGFDNVIGYLDGGFETWKNAGKETASIETISAEEFAKKHKELPVVDVRKDGEFEAEHVDGAYHRALSRIFEEADKFPEGKFYGHCRGGYRSVIANSILKSKGIHGMVDVLGGWNDIIKTDIPRTDYVCPSTL
jgi:glyoxylase-like metal-dependent hydrolase (beta-lactamase superfamily II)/rhodanese-related sulfurtransferase